MSILSDHNETCMNVGELLENPVLLEKESARVGEIYSEKVETPQGMNKGVKTPQEFEKILDNDTASFCFMF